MSFWLFLRIMIGLLAGKIFFEKLFNKEEDYYWQEYLIGCAFRFSLVFISWWGLTPLLDLL